MGKIQNNGEDLFNLLDDDLLIKILCSTKSYKCAVRCSVLSKRWTNLYKMLPCLYLDDYEFFVVHDGGSNFEEKKPWVYEIAAAAIFRHQAQVHSLHLRTCWNFQNWKWCIEHFTDHNIQHLYLSLGDYDCASQHIPSCIFTCTSLVTLNLTIYQMPEDINLKTLHGFPNLRHCRLFLDMFDEYQHVYEWLDLLSCKCPLLQYLKVEIDFPGLESRTAPFVFKSSSLLNLKIYLINAMSSTLLKVIVQTPELLNMKLRCYSENPPGKVEVQAMAPKLLEISVPKSNVLLKLNGLPEKIIQAKWCKNNHQLISLHVANRSSFSAGTEILKNIGKFSTLKSLELSKIQAHPINFWLLLMNLPVLQTMVFSNCCFLEGQEYSFGSQFQYPQTCEKISLREVIIVARNTHSDFNSETVMLRLLLQNTPDLQMLHVVLKKKICEKKHNYASLLGKMLSQDYCLNVNEQPKQVKFTLLRRKITKLLDL